ncbi:MAG: T9SS type A sorting domain-containing protein [Fibrobacteres bacterium]|nr:T9SS type A sorting domain-containing protein [Fibrobacterota bacterium]
MIKFAVLLSALICISINAQDTIEVVKTAGAPNRFTTDQITKITFTATDMVVGGVNVSIPLNQIAVILFHPDPVAVERNKSEQLFSSDAEIKPNPFNPSTTIRFMLLSKSKVVVTVYDSYGRLVATLREGTFEAGEQLCTWNGLDAAGRKMGSAVYQIQLKINNSVIVKRAILVR